MAEKQYSIVCYDQNPSHDIEVSERMNSEFTGQENKQEKISKLFSEILLNSENKKTISLFVVILALIVLGFSLPKQTEQNIQITHQIINQEYSGKLFGRIEFAVRNLSLLEIREEDINAYSFAQDGTQIIPKPFLSNIIEPKINFTEFESAMLSTISYETFAFKFNQTLQKDWTGGKAKLQVNQNDYQNHAKFSQNKQDLLQIVNLHKLKDCYNLTDEKVDKLEYIYADLNYNIGEQSKQLPFCIFTSGSKVYPDNMEKYFNSIQNLNYTNFHVVYVSEFQMGLSNNMSFAYLQNTSMRLKNRFLAVNTQQDIGTLSSLYFFMKKFCADQEIVVVLGKEQQFVGRQALKILNSAYQSQKNWALSFKLIQNHQRIIRMDKKMTFSKDDKTQSSIFQMRSFKRKLMDSVPMEALMGYQYDRATKQVWPYFYKSSLEEFSDYLQFNRIGNEIYKQIDQFLVSRNRVLGKCHKQRNNFHNEFIKLISPLKFNVQLGQQALFQNYRVCYKQLDLTKKYSQQLRSCQSSNLHGYRNNSEAYKIKKDLKIFQRTVYNLPYKDQKFGQSKRVMLNLSQYISTPTKDIWKSIRIGDTKSQDDNIYVLTPTDMSKLIDKIDFWEYKELLESQIPYEIWEFEYDEKLQKDLPSLQYSYFKSEEEIDTYLGKLITAQNLNLNYALANEIFYNPTKQSTVQAQQYYFRKKYKLSKERKELPMCIFTAERNIFRRSQYVQYFDSIERLNYSNYHIVYIDDASSDGSAEQIYALVNDKYPRIKNRMKIVHNLQGVSSLGNMYFWTQKFCGQNDIVVNVDADDAVLGTQAFKVLSSVYEDENIWYVYSNHLIYYPKTKLTSIGYSSEPLTVQTNEYRKLKKYTTGHIRTFRLRLMKAVPIYQLIDFHYNTVTKMARPTFTSLAHDTYQVYAHLQLSGNQRVKFIEDYLYTYYGSAGDRKCYLKHERFDELKNAMKTPMQKLSCIFEKGHPFENHTFHDTEYGQTIQYNNQLISQQCYLP